MAQSVKSLPAMKETGVQSLGLEDSLEKKIATHFSNLAWRITWSLVGYSPWGHKELDTNPSFVLHISSISYRSSVFAVERVM